MRLTSEDLYKSGPCVSCGTEVQHIRNIGGMMQYACSDHVREIERITIKEANKRRARFIQKVGWVDLSDNQGQGRWYKKKWLVTYQKMSDGRWELLYEAHRWKAGGICRDRAQAWKFAMAILQVIEKDKK